MGERRKMGELSAEEKRYLSSLYGFTKGFLGLPVYDRAEPEEAGVCAAKGQEFYRVRETDTQRRVLDAIDEPGSRVSVRTANGVGKTSVIVAGAILWHMAMHPRSTVISTAGVHRQVKDQLWPSLSAQEHKLEGWNFRKGNLEITAPNRSRYLGFVTDDPGKAEGYHGNKDPFYDLELDSGPLMIIVDEGKTVPDLIYHAISRCTYQRLLYVSSPGGPEGEFYKSQIDANSPFKRFRIAADEAPHVDHEKNAREILKRGIDHPLILSMIFAEFMADPEGAVVSLADVDRLLADPPAHQGQGRAAFCDFAAGGDENVLAVRRGNKVELARCWREKDTMAAVGEFIREFRAQGLKAEEIEGDNDGLGKVMIDRMEELGWPIRRASNGEAPHDPSAYKNRGSEIWYEGAEAIKARDFIIPDDDELKAQLAGRKGKADSRGRLAVEEKKEMAKRGLASPDRADAVLGVMGSPLMSARGRRDARAGGQERNFFEEMEREREIEVHSDMGIYAGN